MKIVLDSFLVANLGAAEHVCFSLHFAIRAPPPKSRCTCRLLNNKQNMAMEVETEEERLTATYRPLDETMETDTLVALREPVLQSVDVSQSSRGTLERLKRNRARVYGALAATSDATPQYVKADAMEDLIA